MQSCALFSPSVSFLFQRTSSFLTASAVSGRRFFPDSLCLCLFYNNILLLPGELDMCVMETVHRVEDCAHGKENNTHTGSATPRHPHRTGAGTSAAAAHAPVEADQSSSSARKQDSSLPCRTRVAPVIACLKQLGSESARLTGTL